MSDRCNAVDDVVYDHHVCDLHAAHWGDHICDHGTAEVHTWKNTDSIFKKILSLIAWA